MTNISIIWKLASH